MSDDQPQLPPTSSQDDQATTAPKPPEETTTARPIVPLNSSVRVAPREKSLLPGSTKGMPGYEILGELGRGGMGVVYKARQVRLNRLCALKMILAGGHASDDDLARFHTEAEAIARLQHGNIVAVYEVGTHDGKPFFSLEFCAGGSLDRKLNGTPIEAIEAAKLVKTLAEAMEAAHTAKVIHRDLKPANVLLSADGTVKISDFGLAKKLDDASGQTQTGAIMGSPSYMAPEQAEGKKEVGPLADVYALGAILYDCLTGRPPFKAATSYDTIMQVVSEEPVPPTRLNAKVPRDLETICLKCLEKDPSRRYGSARELAEDLGRFAEGRPVAARPVGGVVKALRWVKRNPAVASTTGLAAMAMVAVTVLAIVTAQTEGKRAAETQRLAETEKQRQRQALLKQARAERVAGNRERALELLREAGAFEAGDDLRQEAILSLATPELRLVSEELVADAEPQFEMIIARNPRRPGQQFNRKTQQEWLLDRIPSDTPFTLILRPDDARRPSRIAFEAAPTPGIPLYPWPVIPAASRASSCGTWLAFRDRDDPETVRVWCRTRGRRFARLTGTSGVMLSPRGLGLADDAFSPSGAILASTQWERGLASLRLHEVATGRSLAAVRGVYPHRWSDDGRFLMTRGKGLTGRAQAKPKMGMPVQHHFGEADGVEIEGEASHLYELTHPVPSCRLDEPITQLEFAPDNKRLIINSSVWEAIGGGAAGLRPLPPESPGSALTFASDGEVWAACDGPKDGEHRWPWQVVAGAVNLVGLAAAQNSHGVIPLTATLGARRILLADGKLRLRRLSGIPEARALDVSHPNLEAEEERQARAFSPVLFRDCAVLFEYPPQIQVWSPGGARFLRVSVMELLSRENKLWGSGRQGCLIQMDSWDRRTGSRQSWWVSKSRSVLALAYRPDGSEVAMVDNDGLALFDATTGKQRRPLSGRAFKRLAFSRDGKSILAVGDDDEPHIFDVTTGKEVANRPTEKGGWVCFAFSPDGRWTVRGREDGYLYFEDRETGQFLARWQAHVAAVTALAFSPDGKTLVTGGHDGIVRAWPIPYLREELAKMGLDW